jgi:translocation and assembly module TamB
LKRIGIKSIGKYLLLGLLTVLLALMASVYWLLSTAPGAKWIWNQVEDRSAGSVFASDVSGKLSSGFVIKDLRYVSDGLELSVRRAELQAGPDLWPLSIGIDSLNLLDVAISSQPNPASMTDNKAYVDIKSAIGAMKLPVPIKVSEAVIQNVTLQNGGDAPVTLINSLRLQASLNESLFVDELEVIRDDLEAKLSGQLLLDSPFALSTNLEGSYKWSGSTGGVELVLPIKLNGSGTLDKLKFSLVSQDSGLELDGELQALLIEPEWDIDGVLDHVLLPLGESNDAISISRLAVASQGRMDDWSFDFESDLEFGALKVSRLDISGAGSSKGIQVNDAEISGPALDIGLSGKLDWSTEIKAEFSTTVRRLNFSPWVSTWPAGHEVSGNLELNVSETSLKISEASLAVIGTELVADIVADIDVDANKLNARVDWQGFSWPLNDPAPEFASPSGSLNLAGSIDQWNGDGQVDLRIGDYPQGRFVIQADGDRSSGRLSILDSEILGGRVSGEADADWASVLNWNAVLSVEGVDPDPLMPGWPGKLDAELALSAKNNNEQIQLNLESVQGVLRGVPIDGRGGLTIEGNNILFDQLEFRTDEAVLQLSGNHAESSGLSMKFNGYLPSALLEGASGNVQMEGRFSSNANHPLMDINLEGIDLAWAGYGVKAVSAQTKQTTTTGSLPVLQLDASALTLQDQLIDEASLSFNPMEDKHNLEANLTGEKFSLSTVLTLVSEKPDDLFNDAWQGVIEKLDLLIDPSYSFKLFESATFEWSSGSALLRSLCLNEDGGAGLCLEGEYQSEGERSLVLDVSAVPLNYLRDLLEMEVYFEQQLEGRLELHQIKGADLTGGAEFRLSAGRVLDLDENDVLSETSEGKFAFALQNGNLESGVLNLGFPDSSFIDIDFDVQDILWDGERILKGRALTRLGDIGLIGHMALPGVDDIGGSLESNIRLGGTIADPAFDGSFTFGNGFFRYEPVGLSLEDIEFSGQLEKRDRGSLTGKFRAGEGIGFIDGNLMFENFENLKVNVALKGDQLLLAETESLKILAEADLRLGLSPKRMEINGRIGIPVARLTPANLVLDSVRDSEDLVIETRGTEISLSEQEVSPKKGIYGQLEVAFGDDVLVKVPGIETNISGSVVYDWTGDMVPIAKGRYVLNGSVDVYGPRLDIDNGRISFPEVAANNPILNIRAQREVLGNTPIRAAGVRVIGTLQKPVLEAFTVPMTNEDRAWTLLVTGSDFDQSQGVNGFDVGTYIAPKLYVSYGISLFEDENVVSARYDLKKGFGIKVTSGQRETGLDASYTIDK